MSGCILSQRYKDWLFIQGKEHKEQDDDLISRQAVLDITWGEPSYTDALNVLTEVRDKVKSLPSVNPQEPKTGHWISFGVQGEVDGQIVQAFTCSECGAISVFRMTGGKIVNGDLCPNCGCRMVEPQERSE